MATAERSPSDRGIIRKIDFDPGAGVGDAARLSALDLARLCDTPPEASFDRITALVSHLLRAPVVLVSLVDDQRQFFKSVLGLPGYTETPLSHSFCQYAVALDAPLVIDDAGLDPVLSANGAFLELGVVAYAGYPLHAGGRAIGTLCAIDNEPRRWTDDELHIVEQLAGTVSDLIHVRSGSLLAEDRRATIGQLVESQELERTRIANELHDDTLQVLSVLSIKLQLLQRKMPSDLVEDAVDLVASVNTAAHRVRRYVSDLRPEALEHDPLANVLASMVEEAAEEDGTVAGFFSSSLEREPEPVAKVTLFRIAQQAIANVLAHAEATTVTVTLAATEDDHIQLTIADDGRGFPTDRSVAAGHFGLSIMRERAELAEGTLRVESVLGEGTTITATIPDAAPV